MKCTEIYDVQLIKHRKKEKTRMKEKEGEKKILVLVWEMWCMYSGLKWKFEKIYWMNCVMKHRIHWLGFLHFNQIIFSLLIDGRFGWVFFFLLSSSVRCDHEFYRAFRGSFDFSFLTNSKILVGLGASALIRKCTKNYVCRRWISFAWMRSNIIHSHKNINSLQSHSSCLTYCLQSARQNQMGKRNRNGKRKRIKGTYK